MASRSSCSPVNSARSSSSSSSASSAVERRVDLGLRLTRRPPRGPARAASRRPRARATSRSKQRRGRRRTARQLAGDRAWPRSGSSQRSGRDASVSSCGRRAAQLVDLAGSAAASATRCAVQLERRRRSPACGARSGLAVAELELLAAPAGARRVAAASCRHSDFTTGCCVAGLGAAAAAAAAASAARPRRRSRPRRPRPHAAPRPAPGRRPRSTARCWTCARCGGWLVDRRPARASRSGTKSWAMPFIIARTSSKPSRCHSASGSFWPIARRLMPSWR